MSEAHQRRALLVGATGLVGGHALDALLADGWQVTTLARRAIGRENHAGWIEGVCPATEWPARIGALRPDLLVSTLGTTWRAAGRDEAAFRAVDQDLVLSVARSAHAAGSRHCITVSSVGADPHAATFYLKVKGEVEEALARIGFARLDILRPGLLRGTRQGETRMAERLGILLSPLTDRLLPVRLRSVDARDVGRAIAMLAGTRGGPGGVHHNDAIAALIGAHG